MIYNLDDKFRVNVTGPNWALQELREGKDKDDNPKFKWVDLGYYPSFKGAVRAIPDHLCGNLDNLSDVIDRLGDLAEQFEEDRIVIEQKESA